MNRSRRRRVAFVAGLAAVLLLVPLIALAATGPSQVQQGTVFNATDGPQVALGEDAVINTSDVFPDSGTVSLGQLNISGAEINVTAAGVEPGDAPSSLAVGDLTAGSVELARDDSSLAVAAVSGNVSQIDLLRNASVNDGLTDFGLVTGASSGTIELRNIGPAGVDLIRPDGTVAKSVSATGGTATVSFAGGTASTFAVERARPQFDNAAASPDGVTRAPGQTVSLQIPVDHGVFPNTSVNVEFRRVNPNSPDSAIGTTTLSANGTATTSWQLPALNRPAAEWYAVATDNRGDTTRSNTFSITLDPAASGDPLLIDSSATNNVLISGSSTDLSIDVEHQDGAQSVDVKFYEFQTGDPTQDPQLGSTSLTTPDTATITGVPVSGQLEWYAVANDSTGQTDTSQVFRVAQPGTLSIRDLEDGTLVDNRTVQFLVTGPGFSETINASDGQLDYDDTSASDGETIFVRVRAADYYQTAIQIANLGTNNTLFLRRGPDYQDPPNPDDPTDNPDPGDDNETVVVRFELIDNTQGKFPPENSTLNVTRADGSVVKSATFGPINRVDATLGKGDRFQLTVEGPDDTRSLGGFTATQSETVPLTIEGRDFNIPPVDEFRIDARLVEQQSVNFIVVEFEDPSQQTSQLNIEIRERNNRSNVIYTEGVTDIGNYSAQVAITDNQTAKVWEVRYEGQRDGERIEGIVPVGGDSLVPLPGGNLLTAFVVLGLTLLAALYSGPLATLGSIILVAVAGGAILLGWLPISPLVWFAAAVVALGGFARTANSPSR